MEGLHQLGSKVGVPDRPEDAEIEVIEFDPPGPLDRLMCCRFTCPEFTSRCPVTGQPDFARIIIDYFPRRGLVESKSLKLFLHSFRNEGAFHERVIDAIGTRLFEAAQPAWMRVVGLFYARGGIPIDVFWQSGELPKGAERYVPPLPSLDYTGGRS